MPRSHTQLTHVGRLDLRRVAVARTWGEARGTWSAVGHWAREEASPGPLSPCGLLARISLTWPWGAPTPDREPLPVSTARTRTISPATRVSEFSGGAVIPSPYETSSFLEACSTCTPECAGPPEMGAVPGPRGPPAAGVNGTEGRTRTPCPPAGAPGPPGAGPPATKPVLVLLSSGSRSPTDGGQGGRPWA